MRRYSFFTRHASAAALLCCGISSVSAFEGKYRGTTPETGQWLTISSLGGGQFRVEAEVALRGCSGSIDARGRSERGGIVVVAAIPGSERVCRITIIRHGAAVMVDEAGCLHFHGASCEFSGSYAPTGR